MNLISCIKLLYLVLTLSDSIYGLPRKYQNYSANFLDSDELFEEIDPELLYISCKPLCNPLGTKTKVEFYLHTRENPTAELRQQLLAGNSESIEQSNFNPKYPTRFLIHGWTQSYHATSNAGLKDAFLNKSEYNVIIVDWSSCSQSINYFHSRCCVDNVGEQTAELIDFLNEKYDLNFKTLKVIGVSLGAHCAGFTGKNVKNGRIHTIIGLDPAKPCFKTDATNERLAASDAEYVETIHTNGNIMGFFDPIGIASFYPNGGITQPGCGVGPMCSHIRSHKYYLESIENENKFIPKKCANMKELILRRCNITVDNIKMGGEPSNHGKAEGIYFLPTSSSKPFGLGEF